MSSRSRPCGTMPILKTCECDRNRRVAETFQCVSDRDTYQRESHSREETSGKCCDTVNSSSLRWSAWQKNPICISKWTREIAATGAAAVTGAAPSQMGNSKILHASDGQSARIVRQTPVLLPIVWTDAKGWFGSLSAWMTCWARRNCLTTTNRLGRREGSWLDSRFATTPCSVPSGGLIRT